MKNLYAATIQQGSRAVFVRIYCFIFHSTIIREMSDLLRAMRDAPPSADSLPVDLAACDIATLRAIRRQAYWTAIHIARKRCDMYEQLSPAEKLSYHCPLPVEHSAEMLMYRALEIVVTAICTEKYRSEGCPIVLTNDLAT